jgi:hypothetical protein
VPPHSAETSTPDTAAFKSAAFNTTAYFAPVVINAYGNVYPWALCPARDEVRDYAVRLAGQVAGRGDVADLALIRDLVASTQPVRGLST